jgi:glycerol-3-phosphate acyltransferase PlsY
MNNVLLLTILGFFSGSLMFSLWVGKLALRRDIRQVGDGNPGAFNLLATSKFWGAIGLLLDIFKGSIPVGIAKWFLGINDWGLLLIAVATILGHAFSPWLRFNGGKAVAVSFGVWVGLTIWEASTFMGLILALWYSIVVGSGYPVLLTLAVMFAYYLITNPDPVYLALLVFNFLLLAYKYRADLQKPLDLRSSFKARLWRST